MNFPYAVKLHPTQTSHAVMNCRDQAGDGEFRAHNRALQNLLGAVIPWACFGQKTAFIREFFCEIHSLRFELFLERKSEEALRVTWFIGYEGRPALKSESLEILCWIDSALSYCFHSVSIRRAFLVYLPN